MLSSVCFFATDIHSGTLGKGKNDDTLVKVRNGELTGKGELVVSLISLYRYNCRLIAAKDDFREASESCGVEVISGKRR